MTTQFAGIDEWHWTQWAWIRFFASVDGSVERGSFSLPMGWMDSINETHLVWAVSVLACLKPFLQISHANRFWSSCVCWWDRRFGALWKLFLQSGHWNGLKPLCNRLWIFSLNELTYLGQNIEIFNYRMVGSREENLTFSGIFCTWIFSIDFCPRVAPNGVEGFPSWRIVCYTSHIRMASPWSGTRCAASNLADLKLQFHFIFNQIVDSLCWWSYFWISFGNCCSAKCLFWDALMCAPQGLLWKWISGGIPGTCAFHPQPHRLQIFDHICDERVLLKILVFPSQSLPTESIFALQIRQFEYIFLDILISIRLHLTNLSFWVFREIFRFFHS